jgi:hypothetical protein
MYLYLKAPFFNKQIQIQIHQKKLLENTFQIDILFKYTSLPSELTKNQSSSNSLPKSSTHTLTR